MEASCAARDCTERLEGQRVLGLPTEEENEQIRISQMALHMANMKYYEASYPVDQAVMARAPSECVGDGFQTCYDNVRALGCAAPFWCQAERECESGVSGTPFRNQNLTTSCRVGGWRGRILSRKNAHLPEAVNDVAGAHGDNKPKANGSPMHLCAGGNAPSKSTKTCLYPKSVGEYADYGDDEDEDLPRQARSKTPTIKTGQDGVIWKRESTEKRSRESAAVRGVQRHQSAVLEKTRRDYEDTVSIVVSKVNFNVSRQSLTKYSEYFLAIRNISDVDCIKLDLDISAATFSVVHEWLTGNSGVALDASNVAEVYDAAGKLGITKLATQCHDFIRDYLHTAKHDPFPLYEHVRTIGDENLFREVHEAVMKKAYAIFRAPYFLTYSVHQVCLLLSDDFICIPNEKTVFDAAVSWLCYDWEHRHDCVERVMGCVRLGLMDEENLLLCAVDDRAALIQDDPGCQDMLIKAFQYLAAVDMGREVTVPHLAPSPRKGQGFEDFADTESFASGSWSAHPGFVVQRLDPPKGSSNSFGTQIKSMTQRWPSASLKAGQDDPGEHNLALEKARESATRIQTWWRRRINRTSYSEGDVLESMKEGDTRDRNNITGEKESSQATICLPGIDAILVFGAVQQNTNARAILRLNPLGTEWHRVGTMRNKLVGFRVAILDKFIYVTGGGLVRSSKPPIAQRSVWRLDVQDNTWAQMKAMCKCRMDHVLVACQRRLYAIGGVDNNGKLLSSMECYYPEADTWLRAAPVPHAKAAMAGIIYRDHVWMCGGIGITKRTRQRIVSSSVDCYDPLRDYWYRQMSMPMALCYSAVAICRGSLYVIGGLNRTLEDDRPTSAREKGVTSVIAYDAIEERWLEQKKLKHPRYKASAVATGMCIYVIGGNPGGCSVERFDEKSGRWTESPSLPERVADGDSLLLPMAKSYIT